MTYKLCERIIKNKKYESIEEMKETLDAFVLNKRISVKQKDELIKLLEQSKG